jgi:hypothetical protein
MSSLLSCYQVFKNVAVRSHSKNRLRKTPDEVQRILRGLISSEKLCHFHKDQCNDAKRFPQAAMLCHLFSVVDDLVLSALRKMERLKEYCKPGRYGENKFPLPAGITTDLDLVKDALDDVASAWQAFEIVAKTEQLREPGPKRIILRHLMRVLGVAIALVQLAAPRHGEWTDAWKEALDAGLPGFRFDTEEDIRKTQKRDPTWASVLPPFSQFPRSYIPLSLLGTGPSPLLIRNPLNGGGPVVVNELAINALRCDRESKHGNRVNKGGVEHGGNTGENNCEEGPTNIQYDREFGYFNGGYY